MSGQYDEEMHFATVLRNTATARLQDTTCGHKYQVAGAADALHSGGLLLNEFVKRIEPLLHGHNSYVKGTVTSPIIVRLVYGSRFLGHDITYKPRRGIPVSS